MLYLRAALLSRGTWQHAAHRFLIGTCAIFLHEAACMRAALAQSRRISAALRRRTALRSSVIS